MKKDELQDLLVYNHLNSEEMLDLKTYVDNMNQEQTKIYYACGKTMNEIKLLPQLESYKKRGFDVLLLCDSIDEFTLKMLRDYSGKEFFNIANGSGEEVTGEEKEKLIRWWQRISK